VALPEVALPAAKASSVARPAVEALPAAALSVAVEAQLMEALRSSSEVQLDYRLYPCHRRIPSEVELEALPAVVALVALSEVLQTPLWGLPMLHLAELEVLPAVVA
jgi:hypothetical protein